MTKKYVLQKLSKLNGLTADQTEEILNDFLDIVLNQVKENGKFSLNSFGKFELKQAKERRGRNPKNGQVMIIPAKKRMTFTPAETIKNFINS